MSDKEIYETEKLMWSQFMDSGLVTYEEYQIILQNLNQQFE